MANMYMNISSDVSEKQKYISYKQKKEKYKVKTHFLKNKTVENKDSYQVIGYLKTKNKKMTRDRIILSQTERYEFPVISKKPKLYRTIGYVQVGKNKYIAVIQKLYLILLIILLLLVLLTIFFQGKHVKTPVIDDSIGDVVNTSEPDENGGTTFPGYDSVYEFSKNEYLYMSNPKENNVYFEFVIINVDANKEIFKSDMVPPDKALPVNLYDLLGSGITNIKVLVNTYDIETMEPCTQFNNDNIKVTIK